MSLFHTHFPTSQKMELKIIIFFLCKFSGKICLQPLMSKIIQDDIEAVTSLLLEKENDLELAAKIGHELLERNQRLEVR